MSNHCRKRSCRGNQRGPGEPSILQLSEDTLVQIFKRLPFEDRKDVLPLVCKEWNTILQKASNAWKQILIETPVVYHCCLSAEMVDRWIHARAQGITELQIRLIKCSPYRNGVCAMSGLSLPHTHGAQHSIGMTADAGASHGSVGKTFLAQLLTRHLAHLEHLSLQQACWMLSMVDFQAIGALRELQSLEILDMAQFNVLGTEPARALRCLGSLNTLTKLVLNLQIPHFPRALCSLPSLATLTLRGATRLRLPACITRLTQLTSLSLPSCGLRGIPLAICGIASLVELNLDMNPLQWEDPDPQPAPGPGGFGGGPGGGNDGPGGGAPFGDFFGWHPGAGRGNANPATGIGRGAGHRGQLGNHGMPYLMDVLDFALDPPQEPNIGPAAQSGFGFPMLAPAGGNGSPPTGYQPPDSPPTGYRPPPDPQDIFFDAPGYGGPLQTPPATNSPSPRATAAQLDQQYRADRDQSPGSSPHRGAEQPHPRLTRRAAAERPERRRGGQAARGRGRQGAGRAAQPQTGSRTPAQGAHAQMHPGSPTLRRGAHSGRAAGARSPAASASPSATSQGVFTTLGNCWWPNMQWHPGNPHPYESAYTYHPTSAAQLAPVPLNGQPPINGHVHVDYNPAYMQGDPLQNAPGVDQPQQAAAQHAPWYGDPPRWPGQTFMAYTVPAIGYTLPDSGVDRPSSGSDSDDPEGFPTELLHLAKLRVLSLSSCDLESLPPLLGQLTSLRSLILAGNRPHALRHAFFFLPSHMPALEDLTHLNLSSCKLEAAPLELRNLVSLEHLDLSNNLLYDIPATLHTLSRLRCLRLDRNRLHVLPTVLTHLTLLSKLYLTGNEIIYSDIAPRVAALPHLCHFTFPTPFDSFSWSTAEGLSDVTDKLTFGDKSAKGFFDMLAVLQRRRIAHQAPECAASSFSSPGIPRPLHHLLSTDEDPSEAGSSDWSGQKEAQVPAAGDMSHAVLQLPGEDADGLLELLQSWPGHAESDPGNDNTGSCGATQPQSNCDRHLS